MGRIKTKHLAAFSLILALGLAAPGCAPGTAATDTSAMASLVPQTGDQVYEKTPVFDKSAPAARLTVKMALDSPITALLIGTRGVAAAGDYHYAAGLLTISGALVNSESAGEKTIVVSLADGSTKRLPIMICTKIIRTAHDLQAINDNLDGTYILGNDIDCAGIANFEPLGWYLGETNSTNKYFHGILDGDGYAIKNLDIHYSSTISTNKEIYDGNPLFAMEAHQAGDNIGFFQIIGSAGVVRNLVFRNCRVMARTIGGIIAGNNSGTIENCIIDGGSVGISTHFWDNDCNAGGIAGIVAASGTVSHVVSTAAVSVADTYVDWSDDYIGQVAENGEHADDTDPYWTFYGANRVITATGEPELDSNGQPTNGVYSGVGKNWGLVSSSYALAFDVKPFSQTARPVAFGQTHLAVNKPTSGDSDMGSFADCAVYPLTGLYDSTLYASFDQTLWRANGTTLPHLAAVYPTYVF